MFDDVWKIEEGNAYDLQTRDIRITKHHYFIWIMLKTDVEYSLISKNQPYINMISLDCCAVSFHYWVFFLSVSEPRCVNVSTDLPFLPRLVLKRYILKLHSPFISFEGCDRGNYCCICIFTYRKFLLSVQRAKLPADGRWTLWKGTHSSARD
jgi:hypothetical protein